MNTLDLLMLIPLAWGAFNGYRKGLLVEIVGIIAFVVAMIVGFKFLGFGIELLSPYISREIARRVLPWLGFSIIFFPTVLMVNQVGFAIRRSLKYSVLGTFDSVAGAAVGVFTWVFGISVILWLLSYMNVKMPPRQIETAFLYPYIRPIAPKVMDKAAVWVPKGLEEGKKWRAENIKSEKRESERPVLLLTLFHSIAHSLINHETGHPQNYPRSTERLADPAG